MSALSFEVNYVEMMAAIQKVKSGFSAISGTVNDPGHVRILTSRRAMTPAEKKYRREERARAKRLKNPRLRPGPHVQGWNISNVLKKKGTDPFKYTDSVLREVRDMMSELIQDAINDAWKTNRPQKARIRQILEAGARELVDDVKDRVMTGKLGRNDHGYMWRKLRLYDSGVLPTKYGRPPPYGIFSGRFIEGVRYAYFNGAVRRISGAG